MEDPTERNGTTTRRTFTKSAVVALMAAPIVASLTGCKNQRPDQRGDVKTAGPTRESCFPTSGGIEEHIPPMGLDGGGGSLIIETRNKLSSRDTTAPFNYSENGVAPEDLAGELFEVRVITELLYSPYITDVRYNGLPLGCQLLLWYQKIAATPGKDDCIYEQPNFDDSDPDVRIIGGQKATARLFKMTVKNKALNPEEKSYKCARPARYRHTDDGSARGHFRIGQWRIVGSDGKVILDSQTNEPFQDNVMSQYLPDHFRLYVTFDDYEPHH